MGKKEQDCYGTLGKKGPTDVNKLIEPFDFEPFDFEPFDFELFEFVTVLFVYPNPTRHFTKDSSTRTTHRTIIKGWLQDDAQIRSKVRDPTLNANRY